MTLAREIIEPGTRSLVDQIKLRRDGLFPAESKWPAGRDGLTQAYSEWKSELAPVREGVKSRVDGLTGPGQRLRRTRRIFYVIGAALIEFCVFAVVDLPRAIVTRRKLGHRAAHRLRRAFEHLGPSYIKFGQFIASGRGLFPDVLVDEFAACRDRCPTLPIRTVRRVVEAEIGPLDEIFESFDEEPISAASIAQVHGAVLLGGERVVVKVQRPGLEKAVEAHIRSMPPIARMVGRRFPHAQLADPEELVRLFATTILQELNFKLEAENMVDIALDLEAAGVSDVVVPRPIPGLVTERVLVMERLDGMHFDNVEEMRAAGIDTAALLATGLRSLVEGATVFGRFHGDLHAGNVICLPDGRFGLIDFGICARLDDDARAGLQRLLVGIATRNPRSQVWGLDHLGAIPEGVDRRRLIAHLAARRRQDRDSMSIDDVKEGAPRIMQVFVDNDLRLPMALTLFFKNVLYLNGSTRLLAPGLDLLKTFADLHAHFDGKYGPNRIDLKDDPYGPPISEDEVDAAALEQRQREERDRQEAPTPATLARRFIPGFAIDAAIPVLLFVILNSKFGLVWAIAAVTVWSMGVFTYKRVSGRGVGVLLPIVLVIIVLRGAIGILTRSHEVYFAPGIVNLLVLSMLFFGSVAFRHPLAGLVARTLYPFPKEMRRHPTFKKVFSRLTLAWGTYLLFQAGLQIFLLATVSPNAYLIGRTLIGYPIALILLVVSIYYPRTAFRAEPAFARWTAEPETDRP